jgi:5-methylcytosine-specific restriction endonuclease McrA
VSPIRRPCLNCGTLATGTRCPTCEARHQAKRNAQPNRAYHRTREHRQRRERVLARDGHRCHWCGGPATELDYLVPLALGGERSDANAVAACKRCNSKRGGTVNSTAQARTHPLDVRFTKKAGGHMKRG